MSQWRGNWKPKDERFRALIKTSYTACPNEEGTESFDIVNFTSILIFVTQHVPMKRELKVWVIAPVPVLSGIVTQHVPMKRELKGIFTSRPHSTPPVTQHVPMKRELKVGGRPQSSDHRRSYTACPNEEGTESSNHASEAGHECELHSMSQWRGNWKLLLLEALDQAHCVTQHVPMKRELKVFHYTIYGCEQQRYTACPNEEGTESKNHRLS